MAGGNASEIRDLAPGLWLWTVPGWETGLTSTCVESDGEVVLLDPSRRLRGVPVGEARRPSSHLLVVLKPDHVRDVDLFARRYGVKAFGPWLFFRDDIPETDLKPIEPGSALPGGLIALYDGRGRNECPLWLPEHRTLVFADGLTAPTGELRVWLSPWHEEPAVRALLQLPFERVIVSHGEPVHDRAAYEQALLLPPWNTEETGITPGPDRLVKRL